MMQAGMDLNHNCIMHDYTSIVSVLVQHELKLAQCTSICLASLASQTHPTASEGKGLVTSHSPTCARRKESCVPIRLQYF